MIDRAGQPPQGARQLGNYRLRLKGKTHHKQNVAGSLFRIEERIV
ncbi:MAG TPA: hypothetical protein VFA10_05065 [Ktedonobacteraceae bacterium]|nr:hypothetical protein [Ktedonobacteraceae bacterium]